MQAEQYKWTKETGWVSISDNNLRDKAQLLIVFGHRDVLKIYNPISKIKDLYPSAIIIGCSTAGEIIGDQICDNSIVATALFFEKTTLRLSQVHVENMKESFIAGNNLAEQLSGDKLKHIFVLSDGLIVNGSTLTQGLAQGIPQNVTVTGGLAADHANYTETFILMDSQLKKNTVVGIGLYSDDLQIGYGSMGGWSSFGIDRLVTRSEGNVVYEVDGKQAFELYKKYLGEQAKGLPRQGLLFPLSIRMENGAKHVVRTVSAVNIKDGSMTFAGDIPEGSYVRLMKSNINHLVEGASRAAELCCQSISSPSVAILISCVGRRLILKQRIEEEIEVVREKFGDAVITGFYSYGEICPINTIDRKPEFHNQTMTITTFKE